LLNFNYLLTVTLCFCVLTALVDSSLSLHRYHLDIFSPISQQDNNAGHTFIVSASKAYL